MSFAFAWPHALHMCVRGPVVVGKAKATLSLVCLCDKEATKPLRRLAFGVDMRGN